MLVGLAAPLVLRTATVFFLGGLATEAFSQGSGEEIMGMALLHILVVPLLLATTPVAIVCLYVLRNQGEDAHRRLAKRVPWWLGLTAASLTTVIVLFLENVSGVLPYLPLLLGAAGVIGGYAYLIVAAVFFRLLRAVSLVDPAAAAMTPSQPGQ